MDSVSYHNPNAQLIYWIYWIYLQYNEKVVFSLKLKLSNYRNTKTYLDTSLKLRMPVVDWARVLVELRGEEGFTSIPGPVRLEAFLGDD